jgi:hypothetical protein
MKIEQISKFKDRFFPQESESIAATAFRYELAKAHDDLPEGGVW